MFGVLKGQSNYQKYALPVIKKQMTQLTNP